ncbi:MAG TPA: hypothetical protein VH442_18340, partial [Micromonosporaceae bacterium]
MTLYSSRSRDPEMHADLDAKQVSDREIADLRAPVLEAEPYVASSAADSPSGPAMAPNRGVGAQTDPSASATGLLSVKHPVGRWLRRLVAFFVILTVATLLLVEAYTNASFAPDGTVAPKQSGAQVPKAVSS